MFCCNPGIGKTTCARILTGPNGLNCNYLYINASDENGIDTIRSKIMGFAQTKSFDGRIKTVVLDEADALTIQAQSALRNTMESCAKTCRFILTGNYKHKLSPAIQSRCMHVEFKLSIKEAVHRCVEILKSENIVVPEDQKSRLIELIKSTFPDMRKTINELQRNVENSSLNIIRVGADSEVLDKIMSCIKSGEGIQLRKYLIENEDRFSGDYDVLLTNFLDYIYKSKISRKEESILIIADHLYKSAFVMDKEINAFSCWLSLNQLHMQ
jgi:DNA polymerase III delta prime subunit